MATKSKSRRKPPSKRPIQAPKKKVEARRVPRWLWALVTGLLIAGIATGAFLLAKDQPQSGGDGPAAATGGLPNTPDYHSLLVAPSNPEHVLLGTHAGLYESSDGGRDWQRAALEGQDAMNLARSEGKTVWTAGHNVFARSTDGGATWTDVRPEGLPSLDLHGFAVDPTGPGILLSRDGGRTWDEVLALAEGAGPVAWSPSDLDVGYAVGFDRVLYRTSDRGQSWQPVG